MDPQCIQRGQRWVADIFKGAESSLFSRRLPYPFELTTWGTYVWFFLLPTFQGGRLSFWANVLEECSIVYKYLCNGGVPLRHAYFIHSRWPRCHNCDDVNAKSWCKFKSNLMATKRQCRQKRWRENEEVKSISFVCRLKGFKWFSIVAALTIHQIEVVYFSLHSINTRILTLSVRAS